MAVENGNFSNFIGPVNLAKRSTSSRFPKNENQLKMCLYQKCRIVWRAHEISWKH